MKTTADIKGKTIASVENVAMNRVILRFTDGTSVAVDAESVYVPSGGHMAYVEIKAED